MGLLSEDELKKLCVELVKENVKLRQVVEMQNKILVKFQGEVDKSGKLYYCRKRFY